MVVVLFALFSTLYGTNGGTAVSRAPDTRSGLETMCTATILGRGQAVVSLANIASAAPCESLWPRVLCI